MYVVTQGHKTNIAGRAESLEQVPEIIREHVGKRWNGSVQIHVGNESITARIGDVAIHYKVTKKSDGPIAQGS